MSGLSEPFIVNVADAPAMAREGSGVYVSFERDGERFPDFGINVQMLGPGEPNGKYHRESVQEDFLVLGGECVAIIDGERHELKAWDLLHCPAGTEHIFVGAGDGPCWILMVGARRPERTIHYPVNDEAARHGASAAEPTDDPRVAYADWSRERTPTTMPWPPV